MSRRSLTLRDTDPLPRRRANTVSTSVQIEAMSGVLERLKEGDQPQIKGESKFHPTLDFLETSEPNKPQTRTPTRRSTGGRQKLISSFGSIARRKSGSKKDKEKETTKEEKIPAAAIAGLLTKRDVTSDDLQSLQVHLADIPSESWADLFIRLGGVEGLFYILYPYSSVDSNRDLCRNALLCILELFKVKPTRIYLMKNLVTVQDVECMIPVSRSTSGSVINVKRKRCSLRLDQMKMISRTISMGTVTNAVDQVEDTSGKSDPVDVKTEKIRVSLFQIMLGLYEFVTEKDIESLVRLTVRVINALCRQPNGADIVLSELQRIERAQRRGNYFGSDSEGSNKLAKSEGSARMQLRSYQPVLAVHSDCFFLLPFIAPIRQSRGNFDAEYWNLLNSFIVGLSKPEMRFMVQSTSLQLGIYPLLLKAQERTKEEMNGSLKGQLDLFHHCLEEGYEEISRTIPPEEQNKYPLLSDSEDVLKITIVGDSEVVLLPYTPTNTMLDILERTATKLQYLRGDEISSAVITNLFSYGLYIENHEAGEGCYFKGRCIRIHSQTLGENNIQGSVCAHIGLLPWNININLANVLPDNSEKPIYQCITVSPEVEISFVIEMLEQEHQTKLKNASASFGFYYPETECWLDPKNCWRAYPSLQEARGGALLFLPRYKPIRVKYEKTCTDLDLLDFHISIDQIQKQLFKKCDVPQEKRAEYGLFLFPMPKTDDCSDKTTVIAEERGFKEEAISPGTYLLSLDITINDILENFPDRNFILLISKRPRFLSIGLRIENMPAHDKKVLAYYDSPVRDLVHLAHKVFGVDTELHCSLAVQNEEGEYTPLRRQSSLAEQGVTSSTQVFLCPPLFSDDPFDDEANIWAVQITPECQVTIEKEDGGLEMKAGPLNVLVRHLTNDQFYDSNFIDTFLLTYESFTSSKVLLRKLIERFYAPPNTDPAISKVVKQRVCVVMKNWVSKCMPIIPDQDLLREIALFANEASVLEPAAKALQKAVVAKLSGKDLSGYHFTSPAPQPNYNGEELTFESLDVIEMARQLTLSAFDIFRRITYRELFGQCWSKAHLQHKCPNLMAMITQFNYISSWVSHVVITTKNLADRVKVFSKFIHLSEALRELGNFSLLTAVISGLNNSAITRLKWTKGKLSRRLLDTFENLEELTSMYNSFKEYRNVLKHHEPPVVPYMGVYCSDLTFIDDGNPDLIKGKINFYKRTLMFKVIKQIEIFQQVPYNLKPIGNIQEWIYSFKCYDDEKLFDISLEIEPRNAKKHEIL